jgi:hypothetical protein
MGYELNRLMGQYGIGTATTAPYSGAARPLDYADPNYAQKLTNYETDTAAQEQYKKDYMSRIGANSIYNMPQFQGVAGATAQVAPDVLKNPIFTTNPDYYKDMVGQAYQTNFQAPGDVAGSAYWSDLLASGKLMPGGLNAAMLKARQDELDKLNATTNTTTDTTTDVTGTTVTGTNTGGTNTGAVDVSGVSGVSGVTGVDAGALNAVSTQPIYNDDGTGNITDQFGQRYNYDTDTGSYFLQNQDVEFSNGGAVKRFARGGAAMKGETTYEDGDSLLSMADIYGLSNPAELPMVKAPVRMAGNFVAPTDAEGFPIGSTDEIIARGRAAVANAQRNSRAGIPAPTENYDPRAGTEPPTIIPASAVEAPAQSAGPRRPTMEELQQRYLAAGSQYGSQIKEARERSRAEMEAFRETLNKAMVSEKDSGPSKAEMYFRLAAALAAPTKTGGIMENVGLAAKELGDYKKEESAAKRAARARNLELGLKGQELSMRSAKEDVDTLQALSAEEARDRRELIKAQMNEYIRSGEPESAAGKQAKDEGLAPGTDAYRKRVFEIAQTSVDARLAQMNATMNQRALAQEDKEKKFNLAQQKFDAEQKRKQEADENLTPFQTKLKIESEDKIETLNQAMRDIKTAFSVNEKAFDASLPSRLQRLVLENTMPEDPKVKATEILEQALRSNMIASSAQKMSGILSDSDIKLLTSVQGIGAKSIAARKEIILQAAEVLQKAIAKEKERFSQISSGNYGKKTKEDNQAEGKE